MRVLGGLLLLIPIALVGFLFYAVAYVFDGTTTAKIERRLVTCQSKTYNPAQFVSDAYIPPSYVIHAADADDDISFNVNVDKGKNIWPGDLIEIEVGRGALQHIWFIRIVRHGLQT